MESDTADLPNDVDALKAALKKGPIGLVGRWKASSSALTATRVTRQATLRPDSPGALLRDRRPALERPVHQGGVLVHDAQEVVVAGRAGQVLEADLQLQAARRHAPRVAEQMLTSEISPLALTR